ncbi:MAG: RNA methyltransferase [Chloroflexi bacterium]|nr:RNA methyltransferase [Chloroflexota bacterium]
MSRRRGTETIGGHRTQPVAGYYAQTMPGFAGIAWTEVAARLPGAKYGGTREVRLQNELLFFDYAEDPTDLLRLRTVEDVFFLLERVPKLPWGYEGLDTLYNILLHSRNLLPALEIYSHIKGHRPRSPIRFRVVPRLSGPRQPYRRVDLGRSVAKALEHGTRKRWCSVDEGEEVEIWANVIGMDFVCGLRLSDESMRHRDYKEVHLPASLRPSVAAALVWLTEPATDDIFLDPLCGVGTILIERGLTARHRLLIGGELDEAALRAAITNIGPKHKPRQLFHWDARRLPLAAHSIDKVATNLPFGVKIGDPRELPDLYRAVLAELDRVLTARGRAVVLTGEPELVKEALRPLPRFRVERGYPVAVLGRRAMVYVLGRPT